MRQYKAVFIFLLMLAIAPGILTGQTLSSGAIELEMVSTSSNFRMQTPPEFLFDEDNSTFCYLENASTTAQIRLDFSEPIALHGLQLEGYLPNGAMFFLQTEKENRLLTIPSGYSGSFGGERLIDVSSDRIVSDNLIIRVEGDSLQGFRLNEMDLLAEKAGTELNIKELVPVSNDWNRTFMNHDAFLVDGRIGTVWTNTDKGLKNQVYWMFKRTMQSGYHSHEEWRKEDTLLFDMKTPGRMEFFKYYLTEESRGIMTFSIKSGEIWHEIETVDLEPLTGWQTTDLSAYGEIEQIKLFLHDPSEPWQPGVYGGIGEIEMWGRENPDDVYIMDLFTPDSLFTSQGLVFDLPEINEELHWLKVVLDSEGGIEPDVRFNGMPLIDGTAFSDNGMTVWEVPLPYSLLQDSDNTLRVVSNDTSEVISVQLMRKDNSPFALSDKTLSDGRLLSGRGYSEYPLEVAVSEGEVDIEELRIYHGDIHPDGLYAISDNREEYLSVKESGSYKDIYEGGSPSDILGLNYPEKLYEIDIAGSQNSIGTPFVKLIYPEAGVEIPASSTYHHKVFGVTDYPDGSLTVNGVPANMSGNYFWIDMRLLGISSPGEHVIEAQVIHENGTTGSDSAVMLVEDESVSLHLDQNDDLYYTREATFVFTGTASGGNINIEANGEYVPFSYSSGFEYVAALEPGLNIITFEMMAQDGETVRVREVRQVFYQAATGDMRVVSPLNGSFTSRDSITVSGSVLPWGLTGVFVNGAPADVNDMSFSAIQSLSEGENRITIIAQYDSGQIIEEELIVFKDSVPPVISSVEPPDGTIVGDPDVIVSGYAEDENDFSLLINGKIADLTGTYFSHVTPLGHDGDNEIEIVARDKAGNVTTHPVFRIYRDTTGPVPFDVTSNVSGWTNNNRPVINFSTYDEAIGLSHYEVSINGHDFYSQQSPFQVPYLPDSEGGEGIPVVVRAYDLLGNYTDSRILFYIDTKPADIPTDFRAVPGKDTLEFKWVETDDDARSYILNINDNEVVVSGDAGVVDDTNETVFYTHIVEDLDIGDVLTGNLRSVDKAGNLSESIGTTGLVGVAVATVGEEDEMLIVEYDEVNLFLNPAILPDEVTDIVVQEVESDVFEEKAINPILSPIYSFSAVTEDSVEQHVAFDELFVGSMEYDEEAVPEGFPEQKLAVYYFDTNWSSWVKVDRSAVDIENNLIIFSTDHFTEFSVQATAMEDISPQELADVDYPMFSSKIGHAPATVSPQGGSLSTSMTELVLPGKNGLDLEIRRLYDSATARGDAAGLNMFASVSLSDVITGNIEGLAMGIASTVAGGTLSYIEDSIEKYFQNNGDYAYSLGQGWRLNFPYMKTNNGGVMVRTPGGSFYDIIAMDVEKIHTSGVSREVTFENHEGEDFTLEVTQVRGDVDLSSMAVSALMEQYLPDSGDGGDDSGNFFINLIHYENYIPSWVTIGATLYTKDGREYKFDPLGRVISIKNAVGDVIDFTYDGLTLTYIEDTYGRKVRFEYQWVSGVSMSVPQISKIWIEGDDREISYDYEMDRAECMEQQLASTFKLSLPLLDSAIDVGGREYEYSYDDEFLLGSNVGAKVNGIGLVLDVIGLFTGGATSYINSVLGISSVTIYGGLQFEWVFPMETMEGPGIGRTDLNTNVKELSYFDYEFCDYIFGEIPTGMSFELATQERPVYSSLKRYDGGTLVFNENYSYDFGYAGHKQFYNRSTSVNNNYLRTEYSYSKKTYTRNRCLDFSDVAAGGIFQESKEVKQVIPYNTGITRYDNITGSRIDSTRMSYDSRLRLTYEKTAQGDDLYTEKRYSYDDWGNRTRISTLSKAGDISMSQVIYNQYQENSIPSYANPFSSPDFGSDFIHDRLRGTVVTESVTGGILEEERILEPRVSWYDYNGSGQLIEERKLVDASDGETWNHTVNEYYPKDSSFESGQLKATVIMDGDDELFRTDVEYEDAGSTYTQRMIDRSVVQHDDSAGTDRTRWTRYEKVTGNPIVSHDAEGYETSYDYDNLDRVTKVIKPGEENPETTIYYNDDALFTRVTDSEGALSTYSYDNLGRLTGIEKQNRYPVEETITTTLGYDGVGNITSLMDPRDNLTEFVYDGAGRVLKETYYDGDYNGRPHYEKNYSYVNSRGRRMTTNEEGAVTYEYLDMQNRAVKTTNMEMNGWIYRTSEAVYSLSDQILKTELTMVSDYDVVNEYYYNAFGQISDELNPITDGYDGESEFSGRRWTHYNYNTQGLAEAETVYLAANNTGLPGTIPSDFVSSKTLTYNGAGELITESLNYHDESLLKTLDIKHIYDKNSREVETIDGNGISTYREYTARGQVAAEIDPLNNRTTYAYDSKDRITSMTGPRGNSGNYPTLDFTIDYEYDDLDRLIKGYLPQRADQTEKPVVSLEYDQKGNLLSRTEPDEGQSTYAYNFRNWPEKETRTGTNTAGETVSYETTYGYDKVGNQTLVTNALGTWSNSYDALNRLTSTVDPTGAMTAYKYDKLDRQIKVTDGNGNATNYVYDLYGNVTGFIDAAGYTTSYSYDLLGNQTKMTDPRNNSWITKYDELARITEEINSRGYSAAYSYDDGGRLNQLIDPNRTVIDYLYYDTGLPQTVTYTNGAKVQTESYTYDEAGVVMTATIDGVVKEYNLVDGTYQPDPMGLVTGQSVSFDGKTYATGYSYDSMNRLEGISYASGREITQNWNNLGQLEGITGYASDFSFNGVGYLESYRQGNGVTANYDFTDNGLLKSLSYNDTAGIDTLLGYAYNYDNAGNMTSRNGDAYGYDVKNQLIIASIEGDSLAVEEHVDYAQTKYATEDILGQEEAEKVTETIILDNSASSLVIDYTYPKRISKVIIEPDDNTHRITPETLAVYTSMYNNAGYYDEVENALITIEETTGTITVEFQSPIFGRYMKLHSHHNELNADGTAKTGTGTFSITGSENITAYAKVGGRNEFYIYDGKGNRTTKSIMSDATYSYQSTIYDNSDLLKTNQEGTFTYRYDANGNLVEKGTEAIDLGTDVNILTLSELTEAPEADYNYYQYEYDLKNRLVQVNRYTEGEITPVAEYLYDIDGYRISKTNTREGTATDYVFDLSGKILEEVTEDSRVEYVFIKERHLARIENDETLFYGTDHINSTVLMTNMAGEVVWSGDASPFGDYRVIDSDEYEDVGLKFSGKDYDLEADLFYFNQRFYDASTGRFISEDPIRDGLNWNIYVSNNPLIFVDPTGLEKAILDLGDYSINFNKKTEQFSFSFTFEDAFGNEMIFDGNFEMSVPLLPAEEGPRQSLDSDGRKQGLVFPEPIPDGEWNITEIGYSEDPLIGFFMRTDAEQELPLVELIDDSWVETGETVMDSRYLLHEKHGYTLGCGASDKDNYERNFELFKSAFFQNGEILKITIEGGDDLE